ILFIVSCSPESLILDETSKNKEDDITLSSNSDLLSSYKNNSNDETPEDYSSPFNKELDGLRYVLSPYLSAGNKLFIGNENKEFIENYFLNPDISNLYMSTDNWERIVKLLLAFDEEDSACIKTFITDFSSKDRIERQYAVAGLMNLLSLKYSLSLEMDDEGIQKSNIVTDLETVEEEYGLLISKAFQLGFTDFSVDSKRLFRPTAYLNRGDAISMLYRIFTNLGLPTTNEDDLTIKQDTLTAEDDISISNQQQEAFSVENILIEYQDYKNCLSKSNDTANKKRLEMLNQAEKILNIDFNRQINKDAVNIDEWIVILNEVFGIETDEIKSSITCKTDGILTFDVAAKSIFDSSYLMGGKNPREADAKELATAREAIPQFDTAECISKFAQMFSSGMLEGIYKIPGFTPKRPVSRIEALLLLMRLVKGVSI
ncbi:MAG: hypothetical protein GX796_00070, partial [Clostridiaceae bacterium]|nr:hypothetical protein [Clostridiaceae bacterium]